MKSREEILQSLQTHLKECEDQFSLFEEDESAEVEEIEVSARIDTLRWAISLFE